MNDTPLLTLQDLHAGYRRRIVLSHLQLALPRGSFTALLGANGSGKTILLKTIAGVLPPIAGRLAFASIDEREPVIGYVPQRESLDAMFLFSALEVVLMGGFSRIFPGWPVPRHERAFARECLCTTGMEELAKRRFSELSGGQKQRVLIARALMSRPDFLILDEPTSGIDAAAVEAVMEILTRVNRKQRVTVLMVTHDLSVVRRCFQEAVWLCEGQLRRGLVERMLAPDQIAEHLELT